MKNQSNATLTEEQEEAVNELGSALVVCKTRKDFDRIIDRLHGLISFRFWVLLIVRLNEDGSMSEDHHFVLNYPDEFTLGYGACRFELIDFVMLTNFAPDSFGAFQHWAQTYREVEERKEQIDPTLYSMHHKFLKYVAQWGILKDGYSVGASGKFGEETWGSIFSLADDLSGRPEAEAILTRLKPYFIVAALKLFLK